MSNSGYDQDLLINTEHKSILGILLLITIKSQNLGGHMTVKTTPVPTDEKTKDAAYFTKILRQYLPELSKKYSISYLGIFGSYVRGEQKEDSDLDVLVEFSKTPDLFEFIGLKQDLSDMLGVKVDLVMKSSLKPTIGERILEEVMQL